MTESFTITVPGPLGKNLGGNARGSWQSRYYGSKKEGGGTKEAREEWARAGLDWMMTAKGRTHDRVKLTITAYFCRAHPRKDSPDYLISRSGYRPTDLDNLEAAMKPGIDGLRDAGLFPNDTAKHVTLGEPHIRPVGMFEEERVEVLVEPMEVLR